MAAPGAIVPWTTPVVQSSQRPGGSPIAEYIRRCVGFTVPESGSLAWICRLTASPSWPPWSPGFVSVGGLSACTPVVMVHLVIVRLVVRVPSETRTADRYEPSEFVPPPAEPAAIVPVINPVVASIDSPGGSGWSGSTE